MIIVASLGCQGSQEPGSTQTASESVREDKSADPIVVFEGGAAYDGITVRLSQEESEGFFRIVSRPGLREDDAKWLSLSAPVGRFYALGRTYEWHIVVIGDFTNRKHPVLWDDPALRKAYSIMEEDPNTTIDLVRRAMSMLEGVGGQ
jgi:hypothetical protein